MLYTLKLHNIICKLYFNNLEKKKREEFAKKKKEKNNKNNPHGIDIILTFIVLHVPHFYKICICLPCLSLSDISYCLHTLKLYSQLHINDYISLFYLYFQIYIMFLSDDSSYFNLYYFFDMKISSW